MKQKAKFKNGATLQLSTSGGHYTLFPASQIAEVYKAYVKAGEFRLDLAFPNSKKYVIAAYIDNVNVNRQQSKTDHLLSDVEDVTNYSNHYGKLISENVTEQVLENYYTETSPKFAFTENKSGQIATYIKGAKTGTITVFMWEEAPRPRPSLADTLYSKSRGFSKSMNYSDTRGALSAKGGDMDFLGFDQERGETKERGITIGAGVGEDTGIKLNIGTGLYEPIFVGAVEIQFLADNGEYENAFVPNQKDIFSQIPKTAKRLDSAELNEFFQHVTIARQFYKDWRLGQTYFNVLSSHYPNLASEIRGTKVDPFHNDNYIPNFLEYIVAK